ncbi:hypothetical protein ACI2LF_24375 [Kribbella sp. NPDC020789]
MARMKKQHHDGQPHNDRRDDEKKDLPVPAILLILLLSLVCLAAVEALLR